MKGRNLIKLPRLCCTSPHETYTCTHPPVQYVTCNRDNPCHNKPKMQDAESSKEPPTEPLREPSPMEEDLPPILPPRSRKMTRYLEKGLKEAAAAKAAGPKKGTPTKQNPAAAQQRSTPAKRREPSQERQSPLKRTLLGKPTTMKDTTSVRHTRTTGSGREEDISTQVAVAGTSGAAASPNKRMKIQPEARKPVRCLLRQYPNLRATCLNPSIGQKNTKTSNRYWSCRPLTHSPRLKQTWKKLKRLYMKRRSKLMQLQLQLLKLELQCACRS